MLGRIEVHKQYRRRKPRLRIQLTNIVRILHASPLFHLVLLLQLRQAHRLLNADAPLDNGQRQHQRLQHIDGEHKPMHGDRIVRQQMLGDLHALTGADCGRHDVARLLDVGAEALIEPLEHRIPFGTLHCVQVVVFVAGVKQNRVGGQKVEDVVDCVLLLQPMRIVDGGVAQSRLYGGGNTPLSFGITGYKR